jgi:hypothetical protein
MFVAIFFAAVFARARAVLFALINAVRARCSPRQGVPHRRHIKLLRRIFDGSAGQPADADSLRHKWPEFIAGYGPGVLALILGILGIVGVGQ